MIEFEEKYGFLCQNSWAGYSETRVKIIGETSKCYRIQALDRMRLPGRNRFLNKDDTTLVPKYAIKFEEDNKLEGV